MATNDFLTKLSDLTYLGEATKTALDKLQQSVPTKVSELSNDSSFQTAEQVTSAIASQISRVYKPSGSVTFADLPEPSQTLLGNVYNVTDKFTTNDKFLGGEGSKFPAGTNVAVVQDGETYKFDVLSGAIDLSGYVEKETGKGLSANDYTDDEKAKLSGVTANATKVEASETPGNIKINDMETTVVNIATNAEVKAAIDAIFATE